MKKAVRPAAEKLIKGEILKRNEENQARLKRWKDTERARLPEARRRHEGRIRKKGESEDDDQGPKPHLRPRTYDYKAFDGSKLRTVGKPYPTSVKPKEDFGLEISWTPQV